MDKLTIFREGAKLVGGLGVGTVVKNAIKSTTPDDLNKLHKAGVWIGTFVVTGLVGDMANDYIDKQFDKILEMVNKEKTDKEEI